MRISSVTSLTIIRVGIGAIIGLVSLAAILLFANLPDANAFNDKVERLFIENSALTSITELRLLEIIAQSGTSFAEVLESYRFIIFVLFLLAAGLLSAMLALLVMMLSMHKRMREVERKGLEVSSLELIRDENLLFINDLQFSVTPAAMEALTTLAEARMDNELLSGVALESLITGKSETECDEAAGATRIKRLRDNLGNQLISTLLVRNVARKGYVLAVAPSVIQIR